MVDVRGSPLFTPSGLVLADNLYLNDDAFCRVDRRGKPAVLVLAAVV